MQPIKSALLGFCTFVTVYFTGFFSTVNQAEAAGTPSYVYVRSTVGAPWSSTANETAMNRAFGTNNWLDLRYETVTPAALFSPTNQFIYMEGSDADALEMQSFITTNMTAMQNWVAAGGRLFLNAAPNEGAGMSFGFGVTLLYNYPSTVTATGNVVNVSHPIVQGPFTPVGTSWTGNSFAHATVSGTNLVTIITNSVNGTVVLGEEQFGSGLVLFGGMTTDNYHTPQPQASNLRANILAYAATVSLCSNCPPTISLQPADQTVAANHDATFTIGAYGNSIGYFWLRNGQFIDGATNAVYTTNNVQLSDSGDQFSCLVSNVYGTVLSSNATMTVVTAPTDWFTELFDGTTRTNDLAYHTLTFTPNGSANFYDACEDPAIMFPTDPTSGTNLLLNSHTFLQLALSNNISIYGQSANVIFLASEGHITLGSGDSSGTATFANHFSKPRISASFAHIHPTENGGTVSLLQLSNRVAITFYKVLEYGTTNSNSFQMELFYDGRIRLTFLEMNTRTGLIGLSAGQGVPPYFATSDLTTYASCGPQPPSIFMDPTSRSVPEGYSVDFNVRAIGSSPLNYFWLRDGQFIADATNSTYIISNPQVSDSGAQFSCLVSNAFGTALSSSATLTVVPLGAMDFQISSLSANNSRTVDHDFLTGDDRGGIAVSASQVFVTGDGATARFNVGDLTGGTSLGRVMDALCSDLRSERVYTLANGTTPLNSAGGTVTTLVELDNTTGAQTGVVIPLSQSFTMSFGNGIFSGYGRVVVYNGTHVYDILLPSGQVTDLGTMVRPAWMSSESWSIWGVAEYFGGTLYLDYREASSQRIVRSRVPDGLVTPIAAFSNLSDMASFTVSVSRNRWYFHHEYNSQFGGSSETLGYADAQFILINTNPPTILTQPTNQTIPVGGTATFSAASTGASPVSYSWFRDGQLIAGATDSSYTTNNVQLSDSGAQFSCLVSNAYGTVLSSSATLRVFVIPTDWFTEAFDGYYSLHDLGHRTLTFTPDGSANFYTVCEQGATNYPTDPTEGTTLTLYSYNYLQLALSNNISIYGQTTNVIFLASAGKVTLGSGDDSGGYLTFENHFSRPGISAALPYLYPEYGGTVSLLQLSNRVVITFDKVMEYDVEYQTWLPNSFQFEMFYDGRIRLTFLAMSARSSLVGLSAGDGVSPYFGPSDLSTYAFCEPQSPLIVSQPQDLHLSPDQYATFTVSAFSSLPLSYIWFRDGHLIDGATEASYSLSNVQLSDSGSKFSCLVSNELGTAWSSKAVLTVTVPPPYFYDAMYDQYLGEGEDFSAFASVFGDEPLSFQWQHDGSNIVTATDATLYLPNISMADQGSYTVIASNPGGSVSSGFYLYVNPAPPTIVSVSGPTTALPGGYTTLAVNAHGSRPLTFQWQKDSYNLTSQTNAFLRIANLLKNQGTYRVVVSNPMGVIASDDIPFTIETNTAGWFANYGGTYKGLFYDIGHYNPNTGSTDYSVEHSNSGFFSLRVLHKGLFSGYLLVDGDRIPFAGKFDAYGQTSFALSRSAFGKDPLFVNFNLTSYYYNPISGGVTCNRWRKEISSDFVATVGGFKTVFSKAYPCPLKGKYTMNFDTSLDMPGYGSACLRIDSFGNVIMAGNMADGTPIAQSVPVSDTGGWPYFTASSWPLYVPVNKGPAKTKTGYRYKGSVIGWVATDPNSYPTLGGTINYRSESQHKQAFYPNGFDLQTTAFGSTYTPPGLHTSVLDLPGATASFLGGNLDSVFSLPATFTNNRLSIDGLRSSSKVDLANGRIVGSFVAPDGSRTNHFTGVINQQYSGIYSQFFGTNATGAFWISQ